MKCFKMNSKIKQKLFSPALIKDSPNWFTQMKQVNLLKMEGFISNTKKLMNQQYEFL